MVPPWVLPLGASGSMGMSSPVGIPIEEQPGSTRLSRMDFWDGIDPVSMVSPEEQRTVWDAVAASVRQQLFLRQGIRIPTLGSFDVVSTRIQVGKRTVSIRKPVFRVAWNLGLVHNLMDSKDLCGAKELKPLDYSKVATDAGISRRQAERCILGTTSLLSRCLGKGHNVALVLRDVGMLLVEERLVRMWFYPAFLRGIAGKRSHSADAAEALRGPSLVVSPLVPIASLTFTGNVIVFPQFELEFVSKRPPRSFLKSSSPSHPLGSIPAEGKQEEDLPLIRQAMGVPGMLRDLPLLPFWSSIHTKRPWDKKVKDQKVKDQKVKDQKVKDQKVKDQKVKDQKMKDQKVKDQKMKDQKVKDQKMKKHKPQLKQLPAIPKVSSGKAGPSPCTKAQVSKWRPAPAAEPRSFRPTGLGHKEAPLRRHLGSRNEMEPRSLEAGKAGIYKVFIHQDPGPDAAQLLSARPELFWSVLKEPQKTVLAGYRFLPSLLVPPSHQGSGPTQWQPLRSRVVETSME